MVKGVFVVLFAAVVGLSLCASAAGDVPPQFFWGNVGGTNFMTMFLNQHNPQYCESGWAHAALSSLADRFQIRKKLRWDSQPNFAVQVRPISAPLCASVSGGAALTDRLRLSFCIPPPHHRRC